jgi:hypothetical protein
MCGRHFCSMNTTLSGSGRIDDIQGHPQGDIRGQTKIVKITEDVRKYADDLIARAKKMKRLLEKADRCKCLALEDCGEAFLALSVEKR